MNFFIIESYIYYYTIHRLLSKRLRVWNILHCKQPFVQTSVRDIPLHWHEASVLQTFPLKRENKVIIMNSYNWHGTNEREWEIYFKLSYDNDGEHAKTTGARDKCFQECKWWVWWCESQKCKEIVGQCRKISRNFITLCFLFIILKNFTMTSRESGSIT